jgi:hypothetical protein
MLMTGRMMANIKYDSKKEFKSLSTFINYADIKIFNSLPTNLTTLIDKQAQFKVALKKYLITHSFYSVDEFILSKNSNCM